LIGLTGWTILMVILANTTDRRARWARLALFSPFHQAYVRLPAAWGPRHGVLIAALMLWLTAMLVSGRKLRASLCILTGACLLFLAILNDP
jgi:hypothetical protein